MVCNIVKLTRKPDNSGLLCYISYMIDLLVYKMQNCSGGVNQDCIKSQQMGEDWKCFFAQVYNCDEAVSCRVAML